MNKIIINSSFILLLFFIYSFSFQHHNSFIKDFLKKEQLRVIKQADKFLNEKPVTITAFHCLRSKGNIHEYFSEGDYWWPNPDDPNGAYIRKDGFSNPNNFKKHRKALRRLSVIVPALVAAYKITHKKIYAQKAIEHLRAWFVTPKTMMNPNLLYSQAIKGITNGRSIGIIDGIHLVEVAKAIIVLQKMNSINKITLLKLKIWFNKFLIWLTTHNYGIKERDHGNNHSTCWAMQVAMFSKLTSNNKNLTFVRNFYKNNLLPNQMDTNGSFPKELARTKPYAYSIFNLDAMAMVCEITSTKNDDLWEYTTPNGEGIKKAFAFLFPFIKDKNKWPYKKDIMYWKDWPVRQPSLLLAAVHFNKPEYYEVWETLNPEPQKDEIIRNFPIRQPLLWIE